MYRSTLTLNPLSPSARRDLQWPYEFHRTLERCRMENGLAEETKMLFCYDGKERIIVQTPTPIAFWRGITHDYALSIDTEKLVLPETGEILEFQLVANPVQQKVRSQQRYPIHGEINQLIWLSRQGARNGFGLVTAKVLDVKWSGRHEERNNKADLPVWCVTFRGVLLVTDAEKFAHGITIGFGKGKMHGLGLLQYRPYQKDHE